MASQIRIIKTTSSHGDGTSLVLFGDNVGATLFPWSRISEAAKKYAEIMKPAVGHIPITTPPENACKKSFTSLTHEDRELFMTALEPFMAGMQQ